MKEHVYRGIIVVMLILFTIFFIVSHHNYMSVLESNEDLLKLVDDKDTQIETVINMWEENYSNLEESYCRVAIENSRLNGVPISKYEYTEEDLYMLAKCVEAEAGDFSNHELSQQYITQVILNRVHSGEFPNTLEEVIYQKVKNVPQFSVAYNGMMDRKVEPDTLANVCKVIVLGTDLPSYVLYFYDAGVTDNWVNTLSTYDIVEGTVFAYEYKEVN